MPLRGEILAICLSLCVSVLSFSSCIGGPTENLVRDCVPTPFERTSIFDLFERGCGYAQPGFALHAWVPCDLPGNPLGGRPCRITGLSSIAPARVHWSGADIQRLVQACLYVEYNAWPPEARSPMRHGLSSGCCGIGCFGQG